MITDRTDHNRFAEQLNRRLGNEEQRANANSSASRHAGARSTGGSGATAPVGKGHNNPPGPIEDARSALTDLNAFLVDMPVIENHDQAKLANTWKERTLKTLQALEAERTDKVNPLNTLLRNINDTYRGVREPLEKVFGELKRRLTVYATAEEAKQKAEAERLRAEAEAQQLAAQRAAQAADQAIADADVGVCTDAGAAIATADAAIRAAGRADRAAARAERSAVRIGSVMGGRASAMRSTEILSVTDAAAALKCMGLTDGIREAMLTAARAYRKEFGELPVGIKSETERRM